MLKNIINIKLNDENDYTKQKRKLMNKSSQKSLKLPWITTNNTTYNNIYYVNQKNQKK